MTTTNEPYYEFVKGQGWVIETTPAVFCKFTGKSYRVELRKPNDGEYCCWNNTNEDWGVKEWSKWLAGAAPYGYKVLSRDLNRPGISWATFIEVEP